MPPEALIKKKDEKEINNFIGDDKKFKITVTKRAEDGSNGFFKNNKYLKIHNVIND